MYTDEDLDTAVEKGILTRDAVTRFRIFMAAARNTTPADEENIRLVSGFNDIFVVMACTLLMYSCYSVLGGAEALPALISVPVLAWGLAEYFVRVRQLALPAMLLLLTFIASIFFLALHLFEPVTSKATVIASACAVLAAYVHYLRFQVPITVAAGVAALAGLIVSSILSAFPDAINGILGIVFVVGLSTFTLAMYWDASDRTRTTRRSDIAFWLHLLASPMIVHPVFVYFGILNGEGGTTGIAVVIGLYALMTSLSILIDRKAFMVSSLLYVIYALSQLFSLYGFDGSNLAITGICLGSGLLLLSAFWKPVRAALVSLLPQKLQQLVPVIS